MGKVIFVNKQNLKIARKNVGLDIFNASKKVSTRKDIVSLWESGEELPTWKQLEKIAKAYNISELVLVSKENIKENRDIPDFRVGIGMGDKNYVKKLIDLVLKRQEWLESTLKKEGYKKNKMLGSGVNIKSPSELAKYISKILDIDIEEIKTISGSGAHRKTLNYLIEKAESQRIFVGKTIAHHSIPVEHMRGLFISNDYCPFIVLNRKDALSAQIFSFIHELAHLFRKSDSISNSIDFRDSNKALNSEEIFCNKVAANLLLPEEEFEKDNYFKNDIDILAEKYKLSKLFIFYRLKDLNKINDRDLVKLELELKEESKKNVMNNKKKKSGGNYYNSMKDSNGALFNKVVANSYYENKIDYVKASSLLKFSVEVYG